MSRYADRARKFHEAIRTALLADWDPIGIADVPEAQDEYDGYVGGIYKLLIRPCTVAELFEHLWHMETEHMGLSGNRQQTEAFAARLLRIPAELEKQSDA